MSVHQIQQVLQDGHHKMLLLSAKGLSMNLDFTYTGSLNLPIASELAGMKEKNFLKNLARMNFHSSWPVFQQVPGGSYW